MRKVYKCCVVGSLDLRPYMHPLIRKEQNVISNSSGNALLKVSKDFDKVLSANAKFNFKETIKLAILDILGLKSIGIHFEKGRAENNDI